MSMTPRLKISAFFEATPCIKYSGAIYPLQHNMKVRSTININKEMQKNWGKEKQERYKSVAYRVPALLWMTSRVSCSLKIFDKPKSAIFGVIVESINIFWGLRSRWTRLHSSWRKLNPLQIPLIISYLIFHSRPDDSSTKWNKQKKGNYKHMHTFVLVQGIELCHLLPC